MQIKITVLGEPQPQGRPRFARVGNHVQTYDPPRSRAYKTMVRQAAYQQYQGMPLKGPLHIDLTFYRKIQTSGSKKTKADKAIGLILPTVKPDLDNYYKAVTDALKGVIWEDDNQICEIHTRKLYGDEPRVEIMAEEITPQD